MKIFSNSANQQSAPFVLPNLPYEQSALEPYLTAENFEYHHKKHHNAYVVKLNSLIDESENIFRNMSLEEVIIKSHNLSKSAIFNNAAQIWNHTFYFHCMKKNHTPPSPNGRLMQMIDAEFSGLENFKKLFQETGMSRFGSGWVWLCIQNDKLIITTTSNADTPIIHDMYPILTCDVWEHAYYINYRNRRQEYIEIFLNSLVNWEFASSNLEYAHQNLS